MIRFEEALQICVTWGMAFLLTSVVMIVVMVIAATVWSKIDDWIHRR